MSIKQYMTWKNIGKNSTPFPKTNSTEFVGESCKIRQFETFPGLESHLYVTTTFILQLKSTRPTKWHSYHSSIFSSFGFAHDSKTERYQTLILAITPKYNWLLPSTANPFTNFIRFRGCFSHLGSMLWVLYGVLIPYIWWQKIGHPASKKPASFFSKISLLVGSDAPRYYSEKKAEQTKADNISCCRPSVVLSLLFSAAFSSRQL